MERVKSKKTIILLTMIMIVVIILLSFFTNKTLADYSQESSSNVGVCYEENWSASKFYILVKDGNNFKYQEGDPFSIGIDSATGKPPILQDVVVTQWEVTGSVRYKKED